MRLYFENRAGGVYADPAGFARLVYKPGPRAEGALLTHSRHLLARHHGRMLVDQRLMQPYSPVEQQLVRQEWLPLAIEENGYRYGAVVQAQDVFARLATATVLTQARNSKMTYRYFDDEAAATAWLLSCA
ncbi:hypothetical protein EJV47_13155 [Hymenobacter gummosus]|uniref:STAS/SEC14 domain-containing protein n=1 Tax=Hymenobacter gummosus TaxID=1776032 RepID=A0A3S0H9D9_9BACT|nr:hypothetical protein [Hymenobacter gummosus]RTQ49753.1 hypothetical protein EJV47_13155 [Hymenobacter gummosus]